MTFEGYKDILVIKCIMYCCLKFSFQWKIILSGIHRHFKASSLRIVSWWPLDNSAFNQCGLKRPLKQHRGRYQLNPLQCSSTSKCRTLFYINRDPKILVFGLWRRKEWNGKVRKIFGEGQIREIWRKLYITFIFLSYLNKSISYLTWVEEEVGIWIKS